MSEIDVPPPPESTAPPSVNKRRHLAMGAAAAVAAVAGIATGWWRSSPVPQPGGQLQAESQGIAGGKPNASLENLWQLQFATPDGKSLNMASMRGKPLLLNFWATWCPPCVEELPLIDRFFRENAKNGWQVLGLAVDQVAPVNAFMVKMPLSFPVAMAGMAGVDLSKTLGNLSGGLPFTIVMGKSGYVLHRKMGRVTTDDLQAWAQLT